MPDEKNLHHFFHIYTFLYINSRRCDFKADNLYVVLEFHIQELNNFFGETLEISLDESNLYCNVEIYDMPKYLALESEYIYLLGLLFSQMNDPKEYIHIYFSGFLKYKILLFFCIILEDITKSYYMKIYVSRLKDSSLKDILSFYYYAFIWDGGKDIKVSLSYLDKLIESYPLFVSFRLFKVRQRFELFYRTIIGKKKFNTLIDSSIGKSYLQNHPYVVSCFDELNRCKQILPDHYVILLFEGKLHLHLLNPRGIDVLFDCLRNQKIAYDTDIFSWIGVYYLQTGNHKKALEYIEVSPYGEEDMYKYYTKIIFSYVIAGSKEDFISLLTCRLSKLTILIYSSGKYFLFKNNTFQPILRPNDINDITKYMFFGINNIEEFRYNKRYTTQELYDDIFRSISKNYYDHWHFEDTPKIFFKIV